MTTYLRRPGMGTGPARVEAVQVRAGGPRPPWLLSVAECAECDAEGCSAVPDTPLGAVRLGSSLRVFVWADEWVLFVDGNAVRVCTDAVFRLAYAPEAARV